MGISEKINNWILSIALSKAGARGAKAAVSTLVILSPILKTWGVDLSVDQEVLGSALSGAFVFAYEFVRNWLSKKQGISVLP